MRFKKALISVPIVASMAFMPSGLWAAEGDVTLEEDITSNAVEDTVISAPRISYVFLDNEFLVRVDGIPLREVADFVLNGAVITSEIDVLGEQEVIEIVEDDNGFALVVNLDSSVLEPGTKFGLVLHDGLEVNSIVPDDDRAWWGWGPTWDLWGNDGQSKGTVRVRGYVYRSECSRWRCFWRGVGGQKVKIETTDNRDIPILYTKYNGYYSYEIGNYCDAVFVYAGGQSKHKGIPFQCRFTTNDQVVNFYIY